jgi:glycosyltransferase involved in cell wall biosynthesis
VTPAARPATVLRIIARLNTGGPAIHTVLLTRGLDSHRYRSLLVTGIVDPLEGDMGYYAEQMNVVPVVIPELSRRVGALGLVKVFVRLCGLIRRERAAIIHTHTATAGMIGRAAGLVTNLIGTVTGRPRARLVHTFHGHVFHGYFSPFRSRIIVMIERVLARITDRIITVSEAVKRDLVERYQVCPASLVTVVPLGLDLGWTARLDESTGELRGELGVARDTVTIGLVGRMTAIKNHALLVEAIALLGIDAVRVFLIGDGELRGEIEAAIEKYGLTRHILLAGWQRDPARIYADLDIVCLTSRNEGTPVALIEAMAAGRPFVATRVGGVEDLVVGEAVTHAEGFEIFGNGILTPPDDPKVLAAALRYLVARPRVRQAMGAVGQAAVLKSFSHERLLQEMQAIYDALLERRDVEAE